MALKSVYTKNNLVFRDSANSAAQGTSLWEDCPILAWVSDPSVGCHFFHDFVGLDKSTESWIATQATSGTMTAGVLAGGTAALSAGAATDNQGINVQLAGGAFVPTAGKDIWYETRLKCSQVAVQFYAGLAVIDTTLIASGAIAHSDSIGFSSVTDDGVLLGNVRASSSSTTTTGTTLVADTYVRLGFKLTGVSSVTFYVNGVAVGSAVTTNIPSAAVLTPSFVCQATGSGTPIVNVDWCRVFQTLAR